MRHTLAVVLVVALAACGKDDPGTSGAGQTVQASCDARAGSGQCSHYLFTGPLAGVGAQNVAANCTGTIGVTCPPAGAVGKCVLVSGSTTITTWYYPSFWTAQTGAASCAGPGGTWSAP